MLLQPVVRSQIADGDLRVDVLVLLQLPASSELEGIQLVQEISTSVSAPPNKQQTSERAKDGPSKSMTLANNHFSLFFRNKSMSFKQMHFDEFKDFAQRFVASLLQTYIVLHRHLSTRTTFAGCHHNHYDSESLLNADIYIILATVISIVKAN